MNEKFKPDWKAFGMWREEARRKERQRFKMLNVL